MTCMTRSMHDPCRFPITQILFLFICLTITFISYFPFFPYSYYLTVPSVFCKAFPMHNKILIWGILTCAMSSMCVGTIASTNFTSAFSRKIDSVQFPENGTAVLKCDLPTDKPVKWNRLNNALPDKHYFQGNEMILPRVSRYSSGIYTCGTDDQQMQSQFMEIVYPPTLTFMNPRMGHHSGSTSSNPEQYVCTATGNPQAKVWFTYNGVEIRNDNKFNITQLPTNGQVDTILYFKVIATEDHGKKIKCHAKNVHGDAEAEIIVSLQDHPADQSHDLSTSVSNGWIAFIVLVLLLAVIAGGACVVYLWCKRQKDARSSTDQVATSTSKILPKDGAQVFGSVDRS